MSAKIVRKEGGKITVEVELELNGDMLTEEEAIQLAVNEVGKLATKTAIENRDLTEKTIIVNGEKMTSKGLKKKELLTPYGKLDYSRNVYQSSQGGKTYCPADSEAKLVGKCSPRLAKLLTSDYCSHSAKEVIASFKEHHEVTYSTSLVRDVSLLVSAHVKEIENEWAYDIPESVDLKEIETVSMSRDGAMIHLLDGKVPCPNRKAGYREAMCGVICLYGAEQELMHSIYVGVGPQKGKAAFTDLFELEAKRLNKSVSEAGNTSVVYVGVADGAKDNWPPLTKLTDYQVTDYYHVMQRLYKLAAVLPLTKLKRKEWVKQQKETLLTFKTGAKIVLKRAKEAAATVKTSKRQEVAQEQVTYLKNQCKRMNYYDMKKANLPIGSGTVEAGCKTLIKQRLGGSGMRWLNCHADDLLVVRALKLSPQRYEQYWRKKMSLAA